MKEKILLSDFKPAIFPIQGHYLRLEEKQFLEKYIPWGIILFKRNVSSIDQVKLLIFEIRNIVPGINILIDEEGGLVSRIAKIYKPYPTARELGKIYESGNIELAQKTTYNVYHDLAMFLSELGVNINTVPVLDIASQDTHDFLQDRVFSQDPKIVSELGKVVLDAMKDAKILGVIKHIPGHGRATCDSHKELPIVSSLLEDLSDDFYPFKSLKSHAHLAMTSHIVYKSIDNIYPATLSFKVIKFIRQNLKFKNLIMTDAIEMKALGSSITDNAKKAFDIGCDLVLYCKPNIDIMRNIANNLPFISKSSNLKYDISSYA